MKKLSTDLRLILFLCAISFLALLAYRVPHLTAWQAQARVPAADPQLQILIPLYSYPNWYAPESYIWDDIATAATANNQVSITAIINPSNGPGGDEQPNDDYKIGLGLLRDAGVTMVGYVHTKNQDNNGLRPISEVKADVDKYDQDFNEFNVNGIFFDEVATDQFSYYEDLYQYVKARPNLDKVIINPGVNLNDERYISAPASDTAVIFEDYSTKWPDDYELEGYMPNYPAERFAMLAHGVPDATTMRSHIDRARQRNIGYVYLTNDTFENNPWDSLPSFWSDEVAYIQQLNSTPKPTATPTATNTPTNTPSATPTATNTPTSTPPGPTNTPTNTPSATPISPTSTNTPPGPTNTPFVPTSTNTPIPTPSGEIEPKILIPLYSYPNWNDPDNYIWDDVAAANSQVPITAIINPNSGPEGPPTPDYVRGLSDLRNGGVTIVGYVDTNYGNRSLDEVKADVDLYDQHFNIDDIFFDRAANDSSKLDYYGELYDYVKSRPNLDKVIINPGSPTDSGYISRPASDIAVIFASDSNNWETYQPSPYVATYPANRFAMLAYGVLDVATMQSHIELAKERNIGYVYLTDDTLANPWDSLPTFWQEKLDYINPMPTPTPTVTHTPTNTPSPTHTPTNTPTPAGVQPEILIPLYSYPNWNDPDNYIWDDVAAANSQVPITAIINPNSGPGGPPTPDYVRGLSDLRKAGVTMVGYVDTNRGNRPVDEVKADVDLYDQHFNIDGIFFDRAANDSSKLDYYGELYDYVKSRPNLDKVIINPGSPTDSGYISRPASDIAVIFASDSSNWETYQPSSYVATYPANRFAMLAYGVPDVATMQSHIELAKERNIGYMYLTDDTLENNPWDSLPTFWQEEVEQLKRPKNELYLPLVIR